MNSSARPGERFRFSSVQLAAAGVYVVVMGLVVFSTFRAREVALAELAGPEAQAEWNDWRKDVQADEVEAAGGVARRTPASAEPPWLVLMRDYFGVCLTAAVVFSSLLFAAMLFFIAALRQQP